MALAAFALISNPARAEEGVIVDAPTANVIKGALKWLATQQSPTGSSSVGRGPQQQYSVAMTGYVLMAYLASGNLPEEGDYAKNVAAGMQFLLDSVQPDGTFSNPRTNTCISMELRPSRSPRSTGRRAPRHPLPDRALVQVIITSQSKTGGWRYSPRPSDADISVSVLQVVALRAAKNGGLDVPQAVIENAVQYVRSCYDLDSGGFTYIAGKKPPGFARTAAAIYSLQVCGIYDDPLVKSGSEYLFKKFRRETILGLRQLLRRARPIHDRRRHLAPLVSDGAETIAGHG